MASSARVRFAVAGLGLMGQRHCRILQSVEGAQLTGVFDRTESLGRKVAEDHRVVFFEAYEDLLGSTDVDAVVLCLPSALHGQFGIPAAHAGKHVVVEKPLDADSTNARNLAAACDAAGVLCATISQYRFSDGIWALKEAFDGGRLGAVTLARASIKWFRHDEYYTGSDWRGKLEGERGGVLMNQAVHGIDMLQWFFGTPQELAGFTSCSRPTVLETEDSAAVALRFAGGTLATLEASTCAAPGFDDVYEFQGPAFSATVRKGVIVEWHHAQGERIPVCAAFGRPEDLEPKLQLFWRQYQNILSSIKGQAELVVTPQEAIAVVETVEQIYSRIGCV